MMKKKYALDLLRVILGLGVITCTFLDPVVAIDSSGKRNIVVDYNQFVQPNPDFRGAPGPTGPPGPLGPRGPIGAPGLKGDKGDVGQVGDPGPRGPRGPPGAPASNISSLTPISAGSPGDKGEPGLPSQTPGVKGEKGDTGVQGQPGPQGPDGVPGPDGGRGPKGVRGVTGQQGPVGSTGQRGMRGDAGQKGEPGPRGVNPGDPWVFDYDKSPPYYCSQSNPSCDRPKCSSTSCTCPSGYFYDPERSSCADIDECSNRGGLISPCTTNQLCVNTPGAFRCYNASFVHVGDSAAQESAASMRLTEERRSSSIPGLIIWLALLTILEISVLIVEITCHGRRCGSSSASSTSGKHSSSPGSYMISSGAMGRDMGEPPEQFFLNPAHIFPDLHSIDTLNSSPEQEERSLDHTRHRQSNSNRGYLVDDDSNAGSRVSRQRAPPPPPRRSINEMMIE